MFYDFECSEGCPVATVSASITVGPEAPSCAHGPMQRVYGDPGNAVIQWDSQTYMERAYHGQEQIANMPTRQVRAIMDAQGRDTAHGRRNTRDYGDKRRARR